MDPHNQTISDIDGFVKNVQVNPIQEAYFGQTRFYQPNTITIQVQLSPKQHTNLLKYGYSGKMYNVYFTVRSNNHVHLYADSTEDINHLLEVIS
ncbi:MULTISPECIES: hypothetical protein [Niallia]|uniref:Uncharacterized protein n=1 Tax=Niallia hominis TaxID=3133173 RepID=A0ABV1EZ54_9BACI|nr:MULTISPECIES: hypothetical protein [Niallia]MCF2649242.1 hypothetical protein [Niallia circulans]